MQLPPSLRLSLFLSSPVIAKGNSAVRASANKDNGGIFRPVSPSLLPRNADGFAMVQVLCALGLARSRNITSRQWHADPMQTVNDSSLPLCRRSCTSSRPSAATSASPTSCRTRGWRTGGGCGRRSGSSDIRTSNVSRRRFVLLANADVPLPATEDPWCQKADTLGNYHRI